MVKRKVGYGGDWIDNLFLVNDKKFFFLQRAAHLAVNKVRQSGAKKEL